VLGERGVAALDLAVRRHGGDTSGHDDDPSVADVIVPLAGLLCYVCSTSQRRDRGLKCIPCCAHANCPGRRSAFSGHGRGAGLTG
jgi:hypothetical protein